MEYILWNRKDFDIVYNCTGINVDDVPIEKRRYPIAAIICIILGFIYYPLYFPCLYSFWKNRAKNPCYLLLVFLSILDMCILWVPSFAFGIFSLNGDVYCSSPISTYFVGCATLCMCCNMRVNSRDRNFVPYHPTLILFVDGVVVKLTVFAHFGVFGLWDWGVNGIHKEPNAPGLSKFSKFSPATLKKEVIIII
ncbi:unnamed protein product [Meloidogyne enterolobii]|uniref:Uncharacterized protein n=1 Tax=Meloidogyne enterolobii TaxID=390850 RepID=A0ACB1AQU2_MELEN